MPIIKAYIIFTIFIATKNLRDSANNGSIPCPSCTIELASKMLKGILPCANNVTKMRKKSNSGERTKTTWYYSQ